MEHAPMIGSKRLGDNTLVIRLRYNANTSQIISHWKKMNNIIIDLNAHPRAFSNYFSSKSHRKVTALRIQIILITGSL